jgi:Xaa-Pro aminopeptidase
VSSEAARKRALVREASGGRLVTSNPADVRWLLCGRGRPVPAGGSDYTVVLEGTSATVVFADIEEPRVRAEERFEELGYGLQTFPWFEAHGLTETGAGLDALRIALRPEELVRYRSAGRDAAGAVSAVVAQLRPDQRELDVAGALAGALHALGFTLPVVLVAGEVRQPVHRHPLPTAERLGRHALLAVTAEREGLHVSLTRIVSFGPPPRGLVDLVRASAEVDAAMLARSRPGTTTGAVLETAARAYEAHGFPDEWRRHHQGGITGYRGREVFAVPGEETRLPEACAVAWNPSITGGGKSEDTAVVTADGLEVVTRTPDLGELETSSGVPRPAIVQL